MYRIAGYVCMAVACCGLPLANAATVTLSPGGDVVTNVFLPDTNYGDSAVLATNLSNYSQKQFTYMMFDLSGIPAGEAIAGATLNLYQPTGAGLGESGVSLLRIADDSWNESTVTWNNSPVTTGAVFLDTNPNGYTCVGWSQWDLFASGAWNAAVDRTDGLLSLWLAGASSNDQAHQWCGKEAASGEVTYCSAGWSPTWKLPRLPCLCLRPCGCSGPD